MMNIGTSKYVVNYYTGKKHKDGSDFYDIKTFSNKKDKDNFIKELKSNDKKSLGDIFTEQDKENKKFFKVLDNTIK